jgi:hypothetical protein
MVAKKETSLDFRLAADKIWEMSKEYEDKGLWELADTLKVLSGQLHELARLREAKDKLAKNNK